MFPAPVANRDAEPHELVDDAASSICIDTQDYVELDRAIQTLQEHPDPQTDFEKYNYMTARQMVLNQRDDGGTIDLESFDQESILMVQAQQQAPFIKYDDFKLMVLGGCASMISMYEMQESIARDGPVGILIGCIVGLSLYSLAFDAPTEMMAFHPLGGYGAYLSQYVHESLGFALDCVYWTGCIVSAGQEMLVALLMLTQFEQLNTSDNNYIIWLIYLFVLMAALQMLNKKVSLSMASTSSLVSAILMSTVVILLLLVVTGKKPPYYQYTATKFWYEGCGGLLKNITCGKFQPSFGPLTGAAARWFQVADAATVAFRVAATTDKLYTFIPKVRNPRKAIPRTIKYRFARIAILFFAPVLCISLGIAMNDPLLRKGEKVIYFTSTDTFDDPYYQDDDPNLQNLKCLVHLSPWEHLQGIRIFLPFAIPCIRADLCQAKKYIAATSIFNGITACFWYLVAAGETLNALSTQRPFDRLFQGRLKHNYHVFRALNVVIVVSHVIICWFGSVTFYMFVAIVRTSYAFTLMALLNVAFIFFYRGIKLQNGDGYVNRNDEDWPYTSLTGQVGAYFSVFICSLMQIFHFPLGALGHGAWVAWYAIARYMPVVILFPVWGLHYAVYRSPFVDLREVNMAAVKRSLDEQEWAEDRVFRGRVWATVHRFCAFVKYYTLCAIRSIIRGRKRKEY